ncbi:restriction endonuclease subunit S [Vibrio splendidus]
MSGLEQTIPDGYQLTEVGVIPDDWKCINFGELGDVVRGGSPRPAGDPKYFNGKYIPWLTVASLTNIKSSEQVVTSTKAMLTQLGSLQSRILESGTLIISNSGATLGVAKILGLKCCANDGVAALINKKKGDASFLVHYLNTQTKRLHDEVATGNGQPNLNTDLIKLIPIPFPSEEEQTAIANALSNVDALLSELEKLIAKKQAIKTATMQQLLTGKTRLPQFATDTNGDKQGQVKGTKPSELGEIPEDWKVVEFGSLANSVGSGKTSTKEKGEFPLFGSTGQIGTCLNDDYVGDALLVARVGANAGTLNFVSGRYGVSDNTIIISIKKGVEIAFYKYLLIRKNLNSLVFGSGQPLITGSQLKALKVVYPTPKEQTAIATILSDMDEEIQALQQRLSKTRQIKQGMMQELLTGKTRLIQGEAHD